MTIKASITTTFRVEDTIPLRKNGIARGEPSGHEPKQTRKTDEARDSATTTNGNSSIHVVDNRRQIAAVRHGKAESLKPEPDTYEPSSKSGQHTKKEKSVADEGKSARQTRRMQSNATEVAQSRKPKPKLAVQSQPIKEDKNALSILTERNIEKAKTGQARKEDEKSQAKRPVLESRSNGLPEIPKEKTGSVDQTPSPRKGLTVGLRQQMLQRGDKDNAETRLHKIDRAIAERAKSDEHSHERMIEADASREMRAGVISRADRQAQGHVEWPSEGETGIIRQEVSQSPAIAAKMNEDSVASKEPIAAKSADQDRNPNVPRDVLPASTPPKIHHQAPTSIPTETNPTQDAENNTPTDVGLPETKAEANGGAVSSPQTIGKSTGATLFAQPPNDYVNELTDALSQGRESDSKKTTDVSSGTAAVKQLQSEGVFGISPGGRNHSVTDFIKQKQFEYEMEQKSFTSDALLRETERAIFDTLNSGQSSTVVKSLLRAAEAVNSFRNQVATKEDSRQQHQHMAKRTTARPQSVQRGQPIK